MLRSITAAALASIALAGCANTEQIRLKNQALAQSIPTCSQDKECELKWSAARSWVLKNSGWKIQHLTSDFIETYNAVGKSPAIAVRVTKEPIPDGGYQFLVTIWCDNIFGCIPDSWDAAQNFNDTLNAVKVKQ